MTDAPEPAEGVLYARPLTAAAFAPYGDVIEAAAGGATPVIINEGATARHHGLAPVTATGGTAGISLFVARQATCLPFVIAGMECHPLGTQAFMPVHGQRFFVVVAPAGPVPGPADLRAFVTDGRQGVSYRPGVWHHPLLAVAAGDTFLVVDRLEGEGNLDLVTFERAVALVAS